MKKLLSLFVVIMMCFTMVAPVAVFAEDTATYAFGSIDTAKVGDTISLPLTLTTSGAVNSIGMNTFTYDAEVLEFVGFVNHEAIDAKGMFKTWKDDMKLFSVGLSTAEQFDAFKLCDVQFKVLKEGTTEVSATGITKNGSVTFTTTVAAGTVEVKPAVSDTATYVFGSIDTANVGDTISLPLTLTTSSAVNSIGMNTFTYDAEMLEFVGFVNHEAIDAKGMFKTWKDDMKLFSVGLSTAEQFDAFKLCDVQFKVLKEGTATVSATGITKNGSVVFASTVEAGTVTVEEPVVIETYDVVFVIDGETYQTITKNEGETLQVADFPVAPAKEGYTFAWDVTEDITSATTVTGSYTAIPVPTYDVVFVIDGETYQTITKNVGETVTVADFPVAPAKEGYTFAWDVTEDITSATTVTGSYTLIPVETYDVVFMVDGEVYETITKVVGETLQVADFPQVPVEEGYTAEWDVKTDITSATTVTAIYTPIPTFTVTFVVEGNTVDTIKKYVGETVTVADFPDAPAKEGYTFAWDVTEDITEAKTVTGIYTPIPKFTVTFVAGGVTIATIEKYVGETLQVADFPAVPAKEHHTGAWDVDADITEDTTVNAIYTPVPTFTVTFVVEGETVKEITKYEGETVKVSEFPEVEDRTGYIFAWDVNTDITAEKTVTGSYTPVSEAATLVVSNGSAKVGETVKVEVSAVNNPGIALAKVKVNYDDTVLELVDVEDGGIWGTEVHTDDLSSPYTLFWNNSTAEENITADGVIATLTFKVLDTAVVDEAYDITLSYDNTYPSDDIMNKDMVRVDFEITNGKVTIAPPTYEVIFVVNGETHTTKVVEDGETLKVEDFPEVPAKEGFIGSWDVKVDITGAMTVTAHYTYEVTFIVDGVVYKTEIVDEGEILPVTSFPAVPAKEGFTGAWDTDADITGKATVTAYYTYEVVFVVDGEVISRVTVAEGDSIPTAEFPAITAKPGYTAKWDVETDITGATTVTAVYKLIIYGDVNDDTYVTNTDLMVLERYVAGWPGYSTINEANSDVDANGTPATLTDVAILARHRADWLGYETLPYVTE